MPRRTALIVPAPEAERHVEAIRRAHDPSAALGVPAHVTLLFPFAPPEEVEPAELHALLAGFSPFAYTLHRVGRFEGGTTWLAPAPAGPFVELTTAIWRRWPRYPPYGGAHAELVPHLTVSETPLDLHLELPIACRAREVLRLVEDEVGRWHVLARFALGSGSSLRSRS